MTIPSLPRVRDYVAYDGQRPALGLNLHGLDIERWIEVDERLPQDLAEKRRLLLQHRDDVLFTSSAGDAGSYETLALLADHLPVHYPQAYAREGDHLRNLATGETWNLAKPEQHPLEAAARLVQEDLCIMGQGEAGGDYALTAACVCFPTRWNLRAKSGRTINSIHDPVPGYGEALASPMSRLFDRLRTEKPVWRLNWSLLDDPSLFQPGGHGSPVPDEDINATNAGERLWLRTERQPLRRLPDSRDILFTIRIYVQSLSALAENPERATQLAQALQTLGPAMTAYKGLAAVREAAMAWLAKVPE